MASASNRSNKQTKIIKGKAKLCYSTSYAKHEVDLLMYMKFHYVIYTVSWQS